MKPVPVQSAAPRLKTWSLGRYAIVLAGLAMLVGNFILDSPLWGLERKILRQWNDWVPRSLLELTPGELAVYSGESNDLPVYVGIDGEVYDVTSSKRMYGPGGAYHCFAGKDAARAFVTGCFETHLTHDLRGLTAMELESLEAWKTFFRTHEKYRKIGRVMNAPVDLGSPIPEPCKPVTANNAAARKPLPVEQRQD